MYKHIAGPHYGGLFIDPRVVDKPTTNIPTLPIAERQRKQSRKPIPSPSELWRNDEKYLKLVNSGQDLTKSERTLVERTLIDSGVQISIADANTLVIRGAL